MANTPFSHVNLLQSQIPVDLDSPEPLWFGSQSPAEYGQNSGSQMPEESGVRSTDDKRRKWIPTEDKILISAWLNTSKDPVVSNEQKGLAFWRRIVDYYNASPQLAGIAPREITSCKQRWARINSEVCKFAGCYDAVLRDQRSGTNDNDLISGALDMFLKNNGQRFSMDHCWRELRHDQKWCSTYPTKPPGKDKRRDVLDVDGEDERQEPEGRPIGVKSAKGGGKKKKSSREEELSKLQGVLELKEKICKDKLLERLMAKKEPLTEMETSLKLKLMSDML